MLNNLMVICACYLLGSIPFAYLVTKVVTGRDIRYEGEGNVGARNVMHVAGRAPGLLVMLLDMSKGAAAYWVAHRFGAGPFALYAGGLALMMGHGFPMWLGFRGGKGLGPAVGFFFPMWPYSVLAALATLVAARSFLPDFNLSVAVASLIFCFLTFVEGNDLYGLILIGVLLGMTGVKKAIDLPHEREIRAQSGWFEGLESARQERDQNAGG